MSSALSTPFLETLDLMDELDPLAKNWRSLVREMAYAIEDCIDDFVHHLGGIGPEQGFIKKAAHRLKTLRDRHRIANQIDELKARVLEANKKVDLTEITQLFQLKYLMVKGYNGAVLPRKIRGLTHLETLNIDGKVECIPSDIIHLPHLSHLIVNSDTMLPDGIASIKSLETIRSIKFLSRTVKALGELANLKELMVVRGYYYESVNSIAEGIDTLVSSLGKLRDLRRLRLQDGHLIDDVDDKLGSLWDPPLGIESIQLERWRFPKVPKWIGGHLRNLWHLVLIVRETSTDEVCVLGELPSLTWLVLEVERDPRDKTAIEFGSTAGFPSLVQFFFRCCMDTPAYMRFQTWCMPRLRWLGLHFVQWEWGGATPAGMEHLSSLQHVNVWMDCDSAGDNSPSAVKEAIEHVFKNAAVVNPNRPSVTIYPIVKTRR
ncbi:hypothetical protein QOZ80_9BG0698010 [Eleusine coracana subsp. coracana]|nr:hypothetical protein QOZ80_9BG0698010 [Eleusine coracana subsp. coracana]